MAGVCRGSDTLMEVQYIYILNRYAINGQTENIIPCATNMLILSNFSSSCLFSPRQYHHTSHNQIAYKEVTYLRITSFRARILDPVPLPPLTVTLLSSINVPNALRVRERFLHLYIHKRRRIRYTNNLEVQSPYIKYLYQSSQPCEH